MFNFCLVFKEIVSSSLICVIYNIFLFSFYFSFVFDVFSFRRNWIEEKRMFYFILSLWKERIYDNDKNRHNLVTFYDKKMLLLPLKFVLFESRNDILFWWIDDIQIDVLNSTWWQENESSLKQMFFNTRRRLFLLK